MIGALGHIRGDARDPTTASVGQVLDLAEADPLLARVERVAQTVADEVDAAATGSTMKTAGHQNSHGRVGNAASFSLMSWPSETSGG